MKTLIINGSPHKQGQTAAMIDMAARELKGEYRIVSSYYDNISPCVDCGRCKTAYGCSIADGMGELYPYIIECDNIILASPLYFSQYTGSFLSLTSRLQMLCMQKYARHMPVAIRAKRGAALLNGGGSTKNTVGVEQTTRLLMRELNCTDYKTVIYTGTDKRPVAEDVKTAAEIKACAEFLNTRRYFL